jgi:hypothetical protein
MLAVVKVTPAVVAGAAVSAVRFAPPVEDARLPLKSYWLVVAAGEVRPDRTNSRE